MTLSALSVSFSHPAFCERHAQAFCIRWQTSKETILSGISLSPLTSPTEPRSAYSSQRSPSLVTWLGVRRIDNKLNIREFHSAAYVIPAP